MPTHPLVRSTGGCLFWPFLFVLLLEGVLLGIGWWTFAAAAIASLVRLVSKFVEAHQLQCELVADMVSFREYDEAMCLSPHVRWELEQVMSRVRPVDLSVVEVAGLLAILAPVHSRVIGGPTSRPGSRRSIEAPGERAESHPTANRLTPSPVSVASSTTPTSLQDV